MARKQSTKTDAQQAQVPERWPKLSDYAEYVAQKNKLEALETRRLELDAELGQLHTLLRVSDEADARALRLLDGDGDSEVADLHAQRQALADEFATIDRAIEIQRDRTRAALLDASEHACNLVAPEHAQAVLRIARAAAELASAVAAERSFDAQLRDAGFNVCGRVARGRGVYAPRGYWVPSMNPQFAEGFLRGVNDRFPELRAELPRVA